MELGVDANQGWRVALIDDAPLWTLERATDFARACAELDIAWLEEPLDMYAYDELAELRRRSSVPIAGGELNGGWHEFKVDARKGLARHLPARRHDGRRHQRRAAGHARPAASRA